MKALLKNYRQSPRKVRLVVNLIKGRKVGEALDILELIPKRTAAPLAKILRSAVANASELSSGEKNNLIVKDIRVEKGTVLKRYMPRARGRASPIRKRMSHVSIVLASPLTRESEARITKSQAI